MYLCIGISAMKYGLQAKNRHQEQNVLAIESMQNFTCLSYLRKNTRSLVSGLGVMNE
jgi:hypothetical protein